MSGNLLECVLKRIHINQYVKQKHSAMWNSLFHLVDFIFCPGIREFCCKVCNYKGVTQSDLNRHMKSQIHMLKSRNECSFCGEGFVTAKNLEKHLDGNCIVKVQQEKGEYLF